MRARFLWVPPAQGNKNPELDIGGNATWAGGSSFKGGTLA